MYDLMVVVDVWALYSNLNSLLPIVFSLKESEYSYVQMVVSGIERQLGLIGGVTS